MSRSPSLTRADWLAAAALLAVNLAVFGAGAARLGFYYDDSTWIVEMRSMRLSTLWPFVANYIPGRNLFPVWQFLLYRMVGDAATHLPAMHVVQSLVDGLAAGVFYLLLRVLSLPAAAAVMSAGLFSFWPIHGETHFWHTSLGANVLPAVFVLLFALTTAVALRPLASLAWWFWPLDVLIFFCALLTYDQGVLVLLGLVLLRVIVALRAKLPQGRALLYVQLPYAAAALLWAKLRLAPTSSPKLSTGAWSMLQANIPLTASDTIGPLWLRHVAPLWANTTAGDWLFAVAVALVIAGIASCLAGESSPTPFYLLPFAIAAYIAAYLPIWLWQIAPRHHYLPSFALFAGVGTVLARLHSRGLRLAALLATAALICAFVAASRGESRYWEQAFVEKRQLFTAIKPDLETHRVLALWDFPVHLGPAYYFVPQDAARGPQILFPSLGSDRTGDVGPAFAPGGVFLRTRPRFHGFDSFRYYPADQVLQVAFGGWPSGRFSYEKLHDLPEWYRIGSATLVTQQRPFSVHQMQAHADSRDLLLSLDLDCHLPSDRYLGAVLSVFFNGGFHRWGLRSVEGGEFYFQPLLLNTTRGLSARLTTTLRLRMSAAYSRYRLDFVAVGPDADPTPLGSAETAVHE